MRHESDCRYKTNKRYAYDKDHKFKVKEIKKQIAMILTVEKERFK